MILEPKKLKYDTVYTVPPSISHEVMGPDAMIFIEPFKFSFFSITARGIDLDYCDIEWFALEMNRDHSVVFEILEHLICLLRNLYAGQAATVRTGHGTTDWFQMGKGVRQGCILSPCLFNLYAEYIMRNAGLEETQARIKIAGRNINNLRYADDINPYDRK